MSRTTEELRRAWRDFECRPDRMLRIGFGPDRVLVAPPTADAWRALAAVLAAHAYHVRGEDTDSYNCRAITGGSGRSLHAFGIALDVNWGTNPFRRTPSRRPVRFSPQPTQHLRGLDVKALRADTDMTPAMIADALAVRTRAGRPVFTWGGHWSTTKDAMHFQVDVTPAEIAAGIDGGSVPAEEETMFARQGDRGARVEYYQRKLTRLSPVPPGPIDGDYGPATAASVAAFQAARVPPVVEGLRGDLIGPWTRDELDRAEAERGALG